MKRVRLAVLYPVDGLPTNAHELCQIGLRQFHGFSIGKESAGDLFAFLKWRAFHKEVTAYNDLSQGRNRFVGYPPSPSHLSGPRHERLQPDLVIP